ncbi:hypothetical protein QFZ54_001811 [Sphingomonas faeni]|nr:hypothetical protein [Sphingomonas faeni]
MKLVTAEQRRRGCDTFGERFTNRMITNHSSASLY